MTQKNLSPFLRALWELPDRKTVMGISVLLSLAFIACGTAFVPQHSRFAELVFDRNSPHFLYPFTIQNFEHIIFFIGLGELYLRWRIAVREKAFQKMNLLPEDDATVLQATDLGPIRKRVSKLFDHENGFLPSLIDLSILQFQSGRSIDQAVAVMQSNLELIQHRVDLRYGLVRYIAWFIPTLGFIGTVIGLGQSLAAVPKEGQLVMYDLAHKLSLGFDCTMIALIWSAILVFLLSLVQELEELAVNIAGSYTLRNLINRLYAGTVG